MLEHSPWSECRDSDRTPVSGQACISSFESTVCSASCWLLAREFRQTSSLASALVEREVAPHLSLH